MTAPAALVLRSRHEPALSRHVLRHLALRLELGLALLALLLVLLPLILLVLLLVLLSCQRLGLGLRLLRRLGLGLPARLLLRSPFRRIIVVAVLIIVVRHAKSPEIGRVLVVRLQAQILASCTNRHRNEKGNPQIV